MLFNSYIFVFIFLPLTLAGWYILNHFNKERLALLYLTGMSLWFYGYFNKMYLLLIVGSILGNYLLSLYLSRCERAGDIKYAKRVVTILGVIFNLGILFYFKYFDFFIEYINAIFKADFALRHILLPLGISFFTFQQLSFIVDRGWGKAKHYSLPQYSAFVTFFPQLIAGPIVLHTELVPQFMDSDKRRFNADNFYDGVVSFVLGLSKKVLLADTLARIANYGFDNVLFLDSFSALAILVAYSLELYFDFSGYSDMAIGLGLMFNITLPVNFNSPYKASSLKNLWGRWHMTLTRFMTTYVYIPLGGNRKGRIRTLINVFIVFLLSGLWHGAAWTYVVWGALTGIIVVWDNLGIIGFDKDDKRPAKIILPKWLGVICTNIAFTGLLIPFRSASLSDAWQLIVDFTKGWTGNLLKVAGATMDIPESYLIKQVITRIAPDMMTITYVIPMLVLIAIGVFVMTRKNVAQIREAYRGRKWLNVVIALLFVYSVVSFSQVSTFIYFNF